MAQELRLELTAILPPRGWVLHLYDEEGTHVGKLAYKACLDCRVGHVQKLAIYERGASSGRGRGIGSSCLSLLVSRHPNLTWYTSWQQPSSIGFWKKMNGRLCQPLNDGQDCCNHGLVGLPALAGVRFTLHESRRRERREV
jgi:hypothetical protein